MQTFPLVSIIMAIKDDEPFLEPCIHSIITQTYTHWELLAVISNESASCFETLSKYRLENRIKVLIANQNTLIPKLKFGLEHAKGQLINRMDSDDISPSNKIIRLVQQYQKYGKGHVIVGGTQHFSDVSQVGAGFKRYDHWLNHVIKSNTFEQNLYKECVIPSHTWMLSKSDLIAVDGFNPEIYPEDYDLTFRFFNAQYKIVGVPFIAHLWREHQNRISRTEEEYKDNRYFDLKVKWFMKLTFPFYENFVLWGAGRNGKALAQLFIEHGVQFEWVSENQKKIGHNIYGSLIKEINNCTLNKQTLVVVAVSNPEEQLALDKYLKNKPCDYRFFL